MRRQWNHFEKTSRRLGLSRRRSSCFFEQLEDRCLLSISPGLDYEHVASDWFDTKVDPVVAVARSFEFVGPLTLAEFEARSALFSDEPVVEAPQEQSEEQWIVRLTPEATSLLSQVDDAEDVLNTSTAEFCVVRGLGLPGQLLVEAPEASAQEVQVALQSNPLVDCFGSNGSVSGQVVPDDTDFAQLWGLNNTGQTGGTADADIDAPEAWDYLLDNSATVGDMNVVVAVIDSGIDYTHPDLYKNIWLNQGEIPASLLGVLVDTDSDGLITFYDLNESANATYVTDSNATGYIDAEDLLADANWADTVDTDGNGYKDDLVGWNFSGTGVGNEPVDGSRHGTHVAGTIAATGNNATGTTGVAWQASIMPLKFLDDSNRGTAGEAILAINYATMMRETYGVNVVVANNSWGYRGDSDPNLRAAIEASGAADILFVAASGNGDVLGHGIDNDEELDYAFYPASEDLDNVLSVAASDDDDRLARFSNYGLTSIDIAAPGVSVLSTEPDDDYRSRYGTSMAAPHVSGTAVLVWSAVSDATAAEVKEAILLGGNPISELQDKIASGKRLNAYGALLVDTAAPRATLIDAPNVDGPGVTETVITVEYRDNHLVNRASVLASQLLITDVADPSTTYQATFQSVDVTEDSQVCTATYLLAAPGGVWDTFDNGDYEVSLQSGQVADSSSNWTESGVLGTFNVDTTPGLIRGTSFEDSLAPGALRAAVIEANAQTTVANVIRLAAGTYTLSIAGRGEDLAATGDLDITHDLTVRGAGADVTTIDAASLDRVFHVPAGVTVELIDLTMAGGDPQAEGGGIFNAGTLTLTRCQVTGSTATSGGGALTNATGGIANIVSSTLFGNSADSGGAIDNQGTLTIVNSTISGNEATANGGGIDSQAGTTTITNATVAENSAATGGGIANSATVTLLNTIVADNSATTDADFSGTVVSSGTNLIGSVGASTGWIASDLVDTDPLLGPLQDNTGGTLTHALLIDSPAIDAGTDTEAPTEDQRGIDRPQDAAPGPASTILLYSAEMDTDPGWTFDPGIAPYQWEWGVPLGEGSHSGDPTGGHTGSNVVGYNLAGDYSDDMAVTEYATTPAIDCSGYGDVTLSFYRWLGVEQAAYDHASIDVSNDGTTWTSVWANTVTISETSWSHQSYNISSVAGNESTVYVRWGMGGSDFLYAYPGWNIDDVTVTGIDVVLADGFDVDIGAVERFYTEIAGVRYHDLNEDGTRDADEPGLPNRTMYLDLDGDSSWTPGEPTVTTTDDDPNTAGIDETGSYLFSQLEPGSYSVGEVDEPGWDQSTVSYGHGIERRSIGSENILANSFSDAPSISADGRYIAFHSEASNLVSGDTNGMADVFVYDQETGHVERISALGGRYPAISADGRYVAYGSYSIYVYDRESGTSEYIGSGSNASISADGRFVAIDSSYTSYVSGDTNGVRDVFVYDRELESMERVSVADGGTEGNAESVNPSISADGRYVAFESLASDLVPADTNGVRDIFVYDRYDDTISRASVAEGGAEGNDHSYDPSLSADGNYIAFGSSASNLVANDTNSMTDAFVRNNATGAIERVNLAYDGSEASSSCWELVISANGRYVAFESYASNLVPQRYERQERHVLA